MGRVAGARTHQNQTEIPGEHSREPDALPGGDGGYLKQSLRLLATGFLFGIFGVGGLFLACVIIPLNSRLRECPEGADIAAQRIIHRSFDWFIRLGGILHIFSVEESGTERLREGTGLVVANHPTLLDVVFLISRMPQADCVVKREAWENFFLRRIVASAGYIPNDTGEDLVKACVDRLHAGRSLIFFPEGSRSPFRGLGKFQRGAAHVAISGSCRITPVVIRCEPPALMKGQSWYALPKRRFQYSLEVGESLRAADLLSDDVAKPLAARQLTETLRAYFAMRLSHGIS
jgi:1-acyl-sn-glycerol-3-phosphate acyltransferase